ncbi:hypothetical protein ABKV19_005405 [Rosa sericea]
MKPKTKRQRRVPDRVSGLPEHDRISGLPDALLCHILSFLQTIYAVRTCVLSTRWKNIWESVPNLDFDSGPFRKSAKLKTVGDHVLFFRNSSNIQRFRLNWNYNGIDQSCINGWIHTAMKRNVVELDLFVNSRLHCHFFELPKSIFMCKTLMILKLRSNFTANNIPASGCFPNLKFLHVTVDHYICTDSMVKLFSSCPVLEDLTIDGHLTWSASVLEIAAPALKTLSICCNIWYPGGQYNYSINCPKLENFVLKGNVLANYYLGQAESLVKANIELLRHFSKKESGFSLVTALLAGVSNVNFLCFSAHCFEVGSLPAYENLRQLKLVIHDCFCWELLTELLKRSPILESLVLECEVGGCPQEDSDNDEGSLYEEDSESEEGSEHEEGSENERKSDHEEGSVNEQGSEHQWNPPDCVPKCCLLHLKIVSIRGFMGERDELEVAKYLLKYGQVLNKMTISMEDLDVNEKEKIYKEFLMVPRGSRTSIVEFI